MACRLIQPRLLILLAFLCALLPTSGSAQKASSWRVYRFGDNLPESACASVTMGSHGRVLVRHLAQPYISYLDGYSVTQIPAPEVNARKVYESPAGQLWMPAHKGLLEFNNGNWELHNVASIANRFAASPQRPMLMPIRPVRQGVVLFLLPDALVMFNAKDLSEPRTDEVLRVQDTALGEFTSMSLARDGGLWVCGTNGVLKLAGPARNLRAGSKWNQLIPPASLGLTKFQDIREFDEESYTMLAESTADQRKHIVTYGGGKWRALVSAPANVRHAWRSLTGDYWAITPGALLEWRPGMPEMIENEEVSARQYFDYAIDFAGNFWLATSDGLFRHAPPAWRVPRVIEDVDVLVHAMAEDREERLWFVTSTGLHMLEAGAHKEFPFPAGRLRPGPPRSIVPLGDGTLLLDSEGGLTQFHPGTATFAPLGKPGEWRLLGRWREGGVCLHQREPAETNTTELVVFDGLQFTPLRLPPLDAALGTDLTSFYLCQNGDYWVGTGQGTALYRDGRWRTFLGGDQTAPEAPTTFIEVLDGKVWCAAGDRLWEFDNGVWGELQRSFDRINSVIRTSQGSVWVASNVGCHLFFQGVWVENGVPEGLPGEGARCLLEDARGKIWAGTSRGLAMYHSEADRDPPRSFIHELREQSREVMEGAPVNLTFSGVDRWKFTSRDRLLFSFRLDQKEWTEYSEQTHVTFPDLSAGKHYFQVRAMDRNCNIEPAPSRLEFAVVLPWYKETRLVLILGAGLALALFFAALAFNRHLQLVRSYAEVEQKVADRTRELEVANRELLQSQKMTALGTLAAGIAHDFNNILSIIKGSAQIIELHIEDENKVRTRIDRIKTVVEQGSGIVKAMLGFSRDSSQQTGMCDINTVVEDTIRLLGDRFLRETKVLARPAPDLPPIVTSKDLIQQILLNFIFNASESMARRKEIIISTRFSDHLQHEMVLLPVRAPGYVEVSVQDFGCGIAPQNLPRIFEPFFTTKALSARRGTGLGLSMVYELARKLEAGLSVETMVNEGSTFTLILPVRTTTEVHQQENKNENTDPPGD